MFTPLKIAVVGASVLTLAGCSFGSSNTLNTSTDTNSATLSTNTTVSVDPTPAPTPTTTTSSLTIVMDEYSYAPTDITLKANQTTSITLENKGRIAHTFSVPELNIDREIAGGQSETFDVTPSQAGSFEIVCTIGGHKELGMHGTVVVE